MKHILAENTNQLIDSAMEFHQKPEFWKAVLSNSPLYFVHTKVGSTHIFSLSKFNAFNNITVEDYLKTFRYQTDGGTTQKHISRISQQSWVPRAKVDADIKRSFDSWILQLLPNYKLDKASFITLKSDKVIKRTGKRFISPEDLIEKLKLQKKIGKIGEVIAMQYETKRLKTLGIKDAGQSIEHVSKRNEGAGYDIYSSTRNETRYIEVKSSLNSNADFFITENEVYTLETLAEEAYIYLVHITDLKKKQGNVFKVLKDPIKYLRKNNRLKPVAYKVSIT